MKNQREICEALLAGETLVHESGNKVKLNNEGFLIDPKYAQPEVINFYIATEWQIYKEPKWYENIPDGGVLCNCYTKSLNFPLVRKVVSFSKEVGYRTTGSDYELAHPLTKQEIQIYLNNAPDGESK
ncbi:MAG: hypothetical protein KAR06_03655 [Deltaproteobacteria bacterium]|nr:hypothetical protein [Deltaproteobacteria bacterium]